MKIAFSTLGCPDFDWPDIYSCAKDLGFDGIEMRGMGNDIFDIRARPFKPENLPATVAELPAGTELYVPLKQGGDCYVCVPENGLAWPMPTEGLYGYVPADSLTIVSDPAALAWVE